jgi:hypothetical protein
MINNTIKFVDIIVPCFNESEVLDIYFLETKKIISKYKLGRCLLR